MTVSLENVLLDAVVSLDKDKIKTLLSVAPRTALSPLLLDKNVFFNLRGEEGSKVRDLLFENGWFPPGDKFGEAIEVAVQFEDNDAVRWYFARWWEKDSLPLSEELKKSFNRSLKECVEYGKLTCLSVLLFRGVHRLTNAIEEEPLLHESIRRGYTDALMMLLDAGFNPNSTPDGVLLPIEVALAASNVEHVHALIQHGAKLYVKSSAPTVKDVGNPFSEFRAGQSWVRSIAQGYPWVHLVLEQSFKEKYDLLKPFMESRAHTTAKTPEGRTMAHELIKDKGWATSPLWTPEERDSLNEMRLAFLRKVMEAGVSPNEKDEQGWTPIMQAALIGDTEALSVMLSYGVELNLVTDVGTALTLACQRGDSHTAAWLLRHGASPDIEDILLTSPKQYAKDSGDPLLMKLFDMQ